MNHAAYAVATIRNTDGFFAEAHIYGDEQSLSTWRSAMNLFLESNGMHLEGTENGPDHECIYTYQGAIGTILADRVTVVTVEYLD